MNPFSFFSWLWKALRGQSVIFAGLFGTGLLGLSVMSWLKAGLRALEVNGLGALLLPMVALALLTRWEKRWWPEIEWRKKWARRIVFGSAILAVLLAWLVPAKTEATREVAPVKIDENAAAEMKPAQAPEEKPVTPRHRGPSGK